MFESALGEQDHEILGVHLASFNKERIKEALSSQMRDRKLPKFVTNL